MQGCRPRLGLMPEAGGRAVQLLVALVLVMNTAATSWAVGVGKLRCHPMALLTSGGHHSKGRPACGAPARQQQPPCRAMQLTGLCAVVEWGPLEARASKVETQQALKLGRWLGELALNSGAVGTQPGRGRAPSQTMP